MLQVIGASVSEPHTSVSYCNFSYIIIIIIIIVFCCTLFRIFSMLSFNTIATDRIWSVSKIFVQLDALAG